MVFLFNDFLKINNNLFIKLKNLIKTEEKNANRTVNITNSIPSADPGPA